MFTEDWMPCNSNCGQFSLPNVSHFCVTGRVQMKLQILNQKEWFMKGLVYQIINF